MIALNRGFAGEAWGMSSVRRSVGVLLFTTLVGLGGCGGDDSSGPDAPSYENIAGSYGGAMAGLSQGIALDADFSLTMTQSSGALSGSYSISGTLADGVDVVPFQGTGVLSGSVEVGNNPSVNIIVTPGLCPNYHATFSGAYDSANQRLTITGPVEFFGNGSCDVALSYSTTIILNR